MASVPAILQHTPLWVWGLLALLVLLGLQAAKPRRVAVRRILVTPLVFVAWGLSGLAAHLAPATVTVWAGAGLAGILFGLAVTRLDGVRADRERGLVELPGSWQPLARNLAIFAARYALAVAAARLPAARDQLIVWDLGISGFTAGYFVGWLIVFAQRYRRTPRAAAAAAAAATVPR